MAILRVRIELQRPRKGIEMSRLAELSGETQKLLRMVADDVGITSTGGTWIAQDFYNQGLGFDAEYQLAEVDDPEVIGYMRVRSTP